MMVLFLCPVQAALFAHEPAELILANAMSNFLEKLGYAIIVFIAIALYWTYTLKELIPWLRKTAVRWYTMNLVIGVASVMAPLAAKFLPKLFGSRRDLYSQGARQDGNKAGMFLTGLLSLCMFGLAPFMGAQKIVNLIKPILDMLKQIPYVTWFADWVRQWWKGEVTFDDLPQTAREFEEHLAEADLKDLQNLAKDIRATQAMMKDCKYCGDNPCKCPKMKLCKKCHRETCVCEPGDSDYESDGPESIIVDEVLNPKPTTSSSSSREEKDAKATEILEDMLAQVEEDVDRGTAGLRASGEKRPKENNIGFDYTRKNFVAANKTLRRKEMNCKDHLPGLEVPRCKICRKLVEECKCFIFDQAAVDDEVLKPEALFDTTSFWNIFYSRKDDVCGKAGEAKQNDVDMKAHFEKRESEIPPYDEKSEEWWSNFWESGPTWDGIWEKCSPTLKKCGEFLYENKHIIAGVIAGLALRYAMSKKDDEYEATPQHRKGKTKSKGMRVRRGGKHFERPSGGAEQEADAYDPYEVYLGRSDEDHDDEYLHEFEDPYYDDSYYQFKGYAKPQAKTVAQLKKRVCCAEASC